MLYRESLINFEVTCLEKKSLAIFGSIDRCNMNLFKKKSIGHSNNFINML